MFVFRRVLEPKIFLTTVYNFFYIQVHVHEILMQSFTVWDMFKFLIIYSCIHILLY